ncbi:MAG: TetR/AcrR family transcriptional regulator [Woeseiaceae bacterium]|nr:TetR/AcrR family transcriptional regulator [Woeseiaceae bacterium]
MSETATKSKSSGGHRMYAKGITRREALVDTAAELLETNALNDISLKLIADTAGIAVGSAYHFFSNSSEVFAELARRFGRELADLVAAPFDKDEATSWQSMWCTDIDRAVKLYERKPAYAKLIIGGQAPSEIKLSDRENDEQIGELFVEIISRKFEFQDFAGRSKIFFIAVEIVDLVLSLSMIRNGRISEDMVNEAKRASIAYLRTYLPETLPERVSPDTL